MLTIVYSTRKENPDYQKQIRDNIGLKNIQILEYVNNGQYSLPEIYNKGLKESTNDYVVFMHDDLIIETNNWGRKIVKHFEKNPDYGIIGIAGTTDLLDGRWWTLKESMTGIVNHFHDNKKWTSKYSEEQNEKIKDVVVVDGLFFVVQKSKLQHNFDEDFKGFHFYDISFAFPNYLSGVRVGVITNIRVTHLSIGMTNEEWEKNKLLFEQKYNDKLPIRLTNNKTFEERLKFDKSKVGVGMVTYKAQHRIVESAPLIPKWIEHFVIVNDGTPYPSEVYPEHAHIIQHEKNECVGKSKSDAIKWLIDRGVEHIFIVEDDVLIQDEKVFEEYIKHSVTTGIKHLNYALQGPANRKNAGGGFSNLEERAKLNQNGSPNPRHVIEYEEGIEIALYPNCVGSFSYYHRSVIQKIGTFDPVFKNAWEHVEHTYVAFKNGFTTPFWWFADINKSWLYLKDIENCIENSTIAHTPEWNENFRKGSSYYKRKHGFLPTETPDTKPEDLNKIINHLYANR